MADKKKRLCPNVVKDKDNKPRCGKEFEYDPDDWSGRCPHCGFNIVRYDDNRQLREVEAFEAEEAAPKPKKKTGVLHNLARD